MPYSIEELLAARAGELAAHDGNPVSTVYIIAAGNLLQTDLLTARDRLLSAPSAPIDLEDPAADEPVPDMRSPKTKAKAAAAPVLDPPAPPAPPARVEEASAEGAVEQTDGAAA